MRLYEDEKEIICISGNFAMFLAHIQPFDGEVSIYSAYERF